MSYLPHLEFRPVAGLPFSGSDARALGWSRFTEHDAPADQRGWTAEELLAIVDDLIECGVSMHDPQLRANTLEGIVLSYRGKLCAAIDLDRQGFPFLTPAQLRDPLALHAHGISAL